MVPLLSKPFMFLWASLGRYMDSNNLVLRENTIFLTLTFPRNNWGPIWAKPLLCSHAVLPFSHLKDYSFHSSPCYLVKITTRYVLEVESIIFEREKKKKERVLETPGRMEVSRQITMIHNRFSESKVAAKLQSFCKNNNKIRLSQSLAEIQIH